jgi:hypothetical protein
MSALTQNERDELEDIFLSIHMSSDKYQKNKELLTLLMPHKSTLNLIKPLKQARAGLKETKLSHFLLKFSKKKKNLSK